MAALLFDPWAWLAVVAFLALFFALPCALMASAERHDARKAALKAMPVLRPVTSLRCPWAADGIHVPPPWPGDDRTCIACQH